MVGLDQQINNMSEFDKLALEAAEFSEKTFGDPGESIGLGAAYHLQEEVDELIQSIKFYIKYNSEYPNGNTKPEMEMEFADCFLLIIDSARKCGINHNELVALAQRKLEINKSRTWGAPDENGVIKHI